MNYRFHQKVAKHSPVLPSPGSLNFDNYSVWRLDDGLIGHSNQALGLLGGLGIEHHRTVHLKAPAWGANLLKRINRSWRWKLPEGPYPDLIVGAGKASSLILPNIKKRCPAVFTVQIMSPMRSPWHYDVVIPGSHTDPVEGPNVLATTTSLHRCTPETLSMHAAEWAPKVAHLPRPHTTVLLGGMMKGFPLASQWDWKLIGDLCVWGQQRGGSLLITTSRRTPEHIPRKLQSYLMHQHVPYYLHDAVKVANPAENPYMGFLGLADEIVVTADSLSMVSEACSTDRPVFIWGRGLLRRPKYERFHDALRGLQRVCDLSEANEHPVISTPLDDTMRAVDFVRERFFQREAIYRSWPARFGKMCY